MRRFSLVLQIVILSLTASLTYPVSFDFQGNQERSSLKVEWKLVNPFRFIKDRNFTKMASKAFQESIKNESTKNGLSRGYRFERALHETTGFKSKGWAAEIGVGNYKEKTYWDQSNLKFDKQDEYIRPKSHLVEFTLRVGNLPIQDCTWHRKNEPENKANCKEPIESKVEYRSESKDVEFVLVVNGKARELAPTPVKVVDKLVVGMGDSLASGEGNPDFPANFGLDTELDRTLFRLSPPTPKKDPNSEVRWLDRRCHRSMYSYQFQTALLLAFSNPKQAVTFVSSACSGAKIKHFRKRHSSQEEMKLTASNSISLKRKKRYKYARPQIKQIRGFLCETIGNENCRKEDQRSIDYLLLSVGINDIGFSKYGAYLMLANKNRVSSPIRNLFMNLLRFRKSPSKKKTDKELSKLEKDYKKLKKRLTSELNIVGCSESKPQCKNIILSIYPDPFNDENGIPCKLDRNEFTIPFGKDQSRSIRAKRLNDLVLTPLINLQLKTTSLWSVVDKHRTSFKTHGICARNSQESMSEVDKANEEFLMPTWQNNSWQSFHPKDYRAYRTKQRWFRLPVDSKLTIDQRKGSIDLFYSDEIGGVLHPTAEGHAETANATFDKIVELEVVKRQNNK